jgi:hypothetical protein
MSNSFSVPVNVNVETVLDDFQMQMADLHCDTDVSNTFRNVWTLDLHNLSLLAGKFPQLSGFALRMTGLSEARIFVSSSLQKMKVVDTKYRNRFHGGRLESCLPVASSHIRACIQKFPDWVDNELNNNNNNNNNNKTLVKKQHKGLWRQNSLDWLTK